MGQVDPLRAGGFAVHPVTGELWAIEGIASEAPTMFRIDASTGVADTTLRLGYNGVPLPFDSDIGFDGLQILEDGTFVATRGGVLTTPDSTLWEIDPSLDPVSGLAEIAVIPLTVDPMIVGRLTGLERAPGGMGPPPSLSCSSVTRGQSTQCVLAGTVDSVAEWRWIGQLATTPNLIDSIVYQADTTIWAGRAVYSGQVEVDFYEGGQLSTLPVPLVVTDRNWRWGPTDWSYVPMQAPHCLDDDLPFFAANNTLPNIRLGRNGIRSSCETIYVEPNVMTNPDAGFSADSVDSGPNDGLWYVTSTNYRMDRGSHVNSSILPGGITVALQRNSEINACRRQNVTPPDTVNFFQFNVQCRQTQTESLIAGIERHEGYGDPALPDSLANRHQRRIEIAASLPSNDPDFRAEDLVSTSYPLLRDGVRNSVGPINGPLSVAADANHVYVRMNFSVSNFVWDSTTTTPQGPRFQLFNNMSDN